MRHSYLLGQTSCPSKSEKFSWMWTNLCYNQDWGEVSESAFCAAITKSCKPLVSTRTASVSVDIHYTAILFINICTPVGSFWKRSPLKRHKAKLAVVLRCTADRGEKLESVTSRWQIAMASWSHCLLTPSCSHIATCLSARYSAFPSYFTKPINL